MEIFSHLPFPAPVHTERIDKHCNSIVSTSKKFRCDKKLPLYPSIKKQFRETLLQFPSRILLSSFHHGPPYTSHINIRDNTVATASRHWLL